MKKIFSHALFGAACVLTAFACSDEARFVPHPTGGSSREGAAASSWDASPSGPAVPAPREPDAATSSSEAVTPAQSPPRPSFVVPRGPCDLDARVGRFSVEKQADFGVIQGSVAEGVVPTAIPTVVFEDGNCELHRRRTLSCVPACVGAQTCGDSGSCIPYPRQVSAGEVTLWGLTRETVMTPQAPGNAYFAPGADNPPYEPAAEIVLFAAGAGSVPSFLLSGVGSEPLERAPSWQLSRGGALDIEWDGPASAVETEIVVELTLDQHGASPLSLICAFEDTGRASIPASVIDQLITSGVSGFPNGRITRRTADHVDLEMGCVELVVGSPLAASITVSGYTPCTAAGDCPGGQVCNLPLQRCE